jgi:crotonobetainyl-CoA:carnitine CoA-transferase CaiB-like acyl-CoA transferase
VRAVTYEGPAEDKFAALLSDIGLAASDVSSTLRLEGTPPVLNSPHQVALAGGVALLAQGAAVTALWERRGGRPQTVAVDARDPVFALNPFPWLRRNDHVAINLAQAREPCGGYFETADGGHVFVTTPSPRQRDRLLLLLGTPNDHAAVAAAIGKYDGEEIEDAFIREGLPGALVRDAAEWQRLPHGIAVAGEPVIRVERIGDGDPEPLGPGSRPLDGIRVADLTHVVAGPTVSRYLAEQGADVLHLGPIHVKLIDHTGMTLETNMGKRSAIVDFDDDGAGVLAALLRDADVFVQAWRPGMLESRGFGPAEVAAARPGIIYVSVSCYGPAGPWAGRAGYDPVALASTGITADEARHDTFKNAPPGVLTDGYAGFLGAAAVASVLARRAVEGGSWHISISLARLATWLQEFGQYPEGTPEGPAIGAPRTRRIESAFGTLDYVAPALRYSETTSYFDKPPVPVGASRPQWLPRRRP